MSEQDVLMQDIFHPASSRNHAVLLLHGLRSTPQEMGYLARALAKQGFAVHAPYLDGYGLGTPCTTSVEWREQVRAHYQKLTSAYGSVSVGGLCIGATLALALAVEEPELLALSLLSVTLNYDGWTIPWYHWMLSLAYKTPIRNFYSLPERSPYGLKNAALRAKVAKSMERQGDSEIGAASLSMHHIFEARALARYVTKNIRTIKADCLLIHAIDDDISTTANADLVYSGVGSQRRRKIFLDDCYHVITMDNERDLVARETQYFFEEAADLNRDRLNEANAPIALRHRRQQSSVH
ncbi:alpha/beta hydrolase family protein [Caballeronia udeis]|uniref:Alpha/beta hydrolase family protein n=1 Tax=Caballeronia udeis TaxID=1232866 RepID=A0A158I2Z3_9BURK|nr:alpha/beta fold hydrolase [Caballeronia udeis]SAL50619.1 alpha/beta hydrolase family protein [Caballeronia udeis]